MQTVFLELVKLSLMGSLFAVAVMLVRFVFRKAPKWLFCILWGVVALRLICPVSVESKFSLIPDRLATGQIITNVGNEYIGDVDIIYESNAGYNNAIEAGRRPIYSNDGYYVVTEKNSLEAPKTVGQTLYPVLSWIWVIGMILMLAYTAVSYLLLRRKMEEATQLRDNIWQCEQVDSPFVLGFIKPRIYLPYAITDSDMANVIAHEHSHIQRKDHWWKPIGFLLLSIHWFNPVLWLAYVLLCRDIEAACDEKVIKHMGKDEMRAYSTALLHCSVHRRKIAACPLAFGEVGVKERIKRVMNYKKPEFWIIVVAILVSVIVVCCFLTEPTNPASAKDYTISSYLTPTEQTEVKEAYNQSSKSITVTVKFISTEGPTQIELAYQYKKNATKKWTQPDPVKMSLGESTTFTIPADNHFIFIAKSLGGLSGNVTFAIGEGPNAGNSDSADAGYYLLIGSDGVGSIEVSGPNSSGGAVNADGSNFKKGEKVWLEQLQGVTDLRGYSITAYGENGNIIYMLSIPVSATDSEVVNLVSGDGWLLAPSDFERKLSQVSGKTYVYENEGILGSFHITLYNDGTFTYYEGNASSYFGVGTWKQDGDLITMTDDGEGGYGLVNHFTLNGNDLIFIERSSSNFIYVKVKTGEKFYYTGEAYKPNSVTGELTYLGGDQKISLNDVIMLSQKGYELTWSDFEKYKYYETGSGLYIRVYPINDIYEVWIGGSIAAGQDNKPMYIYLTLVNSLDERIDIRDGGVAAFISGYSNNDYTATTASDEMADNQQLPLTIVSNGDNVAPYLYFAYSGEWVGNGFICADGVELLSVLEELEGAGRIPHVEYSRNFNVVLGDGVTTKEILLFDEAFNRLDTIWDFGDLSKLDAGNYYVGIVANKEGDYIEEVNRNEYTGWICVVRLFVNPVESTSAICTRINLSYCANKDNSIMIEDAATCSELMAFISKADGMQGESTKGHYGAPYTLTLYFEGEEPLSFTVWNNGQYSTSKHRDNEGYEFFFNDDISDLYKYLEEKYPVEFWCPDMVDKAFDVTVAYANYAGWEDLNEIYAKALNSDTFTQSSVWHLPIYKLDTQADLIAFKAAIDGILSVDQSYDEIPSFNDAMAKYDEAFFEENALMLVYVTAGSGTYRFGVDSVEFADGRFCIHVKRTKKPGFFTEDMAGWFITVAIPDHVANACFKFDADLDNIQKQSEIPGAVVHVVDIWDQTMREQIACASALEKFWEDENAEYYFECIKSQYIMVMDSTGRTVDVVTALQEGLITIEALDHYCIGYGTELKK